MRKKSVSKISFIEESMEKIKGQTSIDKTIKVRNSALEDFWKIVLTNIID